MSYLYDTWGRIEEFNVSKSAVALSQLSLPELILRKQSARHWDKEQIKYIIIILINFIAHNAFFLVFQILNCFFL